MSFTKLDYCQYLLSSPINYTVKNLADHLDGISHDRINGYLRDQKLSPRLLWDNVNLLLQPSENAYLLFGDTVLDKRHSTSCLPDGQNHLSDQAWNPVGLLN